MNKRGNITVIMVLTIIGLIITAAGFVIQLKTMPAPRCDQTYNLSCIDKYVGENGVCPTSVYVTSCDGTQPIVRCRGIDGTTHDQVVPEDSVTACRT